MLTKRIKLDPKAVKQLIQKRKAENRVYALSTPGPTGCFADCCGCCDPYCCPCTDEILAAMQTPFDFTVSGSFSIDCDEFPDDCTDSDSTNTWTACPDPFAVPFIFNFCEPTDICGPCGSYTLFFCDFFSIVFYFYCCGNTWGYTMFFEGSQLGCGDDPLIPVLCTQYGTVDFEDCNEITAEIPFEFDSFRTEDLGGGSCLVTGTITITV